MRNTVYYLVQLAMIIALAPLVNGVVGKVKALSQKRRGAPLGQMYFDLAKLLKKQAVVSQTASWIFWLTPYVVFASAVTAAMLVPVTTLVPTPGFPGDMLMMVYLLVLGRFFMMLAGLDTGSTFGGMGASREGMISSLIEPSILVSLFTVGLISRSTSLWQIMVTAKGSLPFADPAYLMVFLALFAVTLAETARLPVDDPATHLELTMVHEAMILEYSGRHLALLEYGAAIKQLIFITLLVNVFLPHDQLIGLAGVAGVALSLLLFLFKVVIMAVLIGAVEVCTVKFRFFSVPNLAALSFILSFLGFLQYFILGR